MLQHDVVSPRPYSRINALCGTRGHLLRLPGTARIDQPAQHGLNRKAHEWLKRKRYGERCGKSSRTHFGASWPTPAGSGHGGMDYVMNWRPPRLRPAAALFARTAMSTMPPRESCIIELSTRSVATGSMPVNFPRLYPGTLERCRRSHAEAPAQRNLAPGPTIVILPRSNGAQPAFAAAGPRTGRPS